MRDKDVNIGDLCVQCKEKMQYLEAGINQDWNLYPSGGRELDSDKVSRYLSTIPEEYVEAAIFVINNTKYVSYDEFRDNLQRSFELFQNSINDQPFYLVYPMQGKIGSENWLTHLLYPQIRQMNLIGFLNNKDNKDNKDNILADIPSESNILLIDDAIYSGCNMAGTIDGMSYPDARKKNFTFHLVVPYTTKDGRKTIEGVNSQRFNVVFYSVVEMVNTDKLSGNNPSVARFNDDLGSEDSPIAIYFDHKVANEFGSYPQLYLHGAIPQPRSLDVVDSENIWLPSSEQCEHIDTLQKTGSLLKMLPTRDPILHVGKLIMDVDNS